MKLTVLLFSVILLFQNCTNQSAQNETVAGADTLKKDSMQTPKIESVSFPSTDGITVSAVLYQVSKNAPVIVLCHQARYNKAEYAEIAPKLNALGFNCLAIDQRSGGVFDGKENETFNMATQKKLPTEYLDAEPDIVSAVNYASKRFAQKIILWGSSYSASLSLKVGAENENVRAVIVFSPGEYFDKKLQVAKSAQNLAKPLFATSSKEESQQTADLIKNINSPNKIHFIPVKDGVHGSSALMSKTPNNQEYWDAVTAFLQKIK